MSTASEIAHNVTIDDVAVSAYNIPTDKPESDGTLKWESTTMVLVEISAADVKGVGYSYANRAAATLIHNTLGDEVEGLNAFDIPAAWRAMKTAIRNQGNCGIAFMALSAVDSALWDLKAKLLDLPLVKLLGQVKEGMPIYGSGGFTSYSLKELKEQLSGWVDDGIPRVKMKIGRRPENDIERIRQAREAIGPGIELFVDANGAYTQKQAIDMAQKFIEYNVSWYEEPVSSDNLEGLNLIRNNVPAPIEVAAGEYGYRLSYFKDMIAAGAVDVMQADATRCGGITGFLRAGTICDAWHVPFSSHCAPALHLHAAPALENFRHAEYFHDHVRIENILFDGTQFPDKGVIKPDLSRPGFGLEFKHKDAEKYRF